MSEIKDYTKIKVVGKSWKGSWRKSLWVHQIQNNYNDVFVPKSIVKGIVEYKEEDRIPAVQMYVPNWFFEKHKRDLQRFVI